MKDKLKEFKPSSWSIDNKTSIYLLTIIITLLGIVSYINLPKEKFPDIVIPTIYVSTIYPGTSPADMENLVTRPIEKQIKSISGVKKLTSNSVQDYSMVMVEFNTDVDVPVAKQKVKDAVDKAKSDLPDDLPDDPNVVEVDFSEMPIMYVNISGDYDLNRLKKYAEDLQDRIEGLREITRVDIVGALDREIQINVDMHKMQIAKLTLNDIENAIKSENITISGGLIKMGEMKRAISVVGEFNNVDQIKNIVVKSMTGAPVYLKDIAEVKDSYADRESYARLDHKNVITLNVIKRSGENLIESSDKIRDIVNDMKEDKFPSNLKVTITGDQSTQTRHTVNELINTIIIGFILVTLILMFFMGVTNALFVGLSVPLSMFIAFLFMPAIGFSMNMIVLFSFLLALGIVVDDAIVVIENTHRIFENGKVDIVTAAKGAAGEIFLPVFAGTMTTLAPFVPLAFWPGIVGKFMYFLPVTLIITLLASLFVAYIMNPVFAVSFMKPHTHEGHLPFIKRYKGTLIAGIIFLALALISYLGGSVGMGNFFILLILLMVIDRLILTGIILKFQTNIWPAFQNGYKNFISWILVGWVKPVAFIVGTIFLFIFSIVLVKMSDSKVSFFPKGDPNFVYVYLTMPIGTDPAVTDSVTQLIEKKVYGVIGDYNSIVESVISNVAVGASDPADNDRSVASNKSRVSVAFVEYAYRNGQSTKEYLDKIREAVKGIPGTQITVDQERSGPPTGKPINIEVSGENYKDLIVSSTGFMRYLDSLQIPGVEELKSDLQNNKPEVIINIDRERARREGLSTAQIGMEVRTAIFGKEVSDYKEDEDEYPIELRYSSEQRNSLEQLMNLKITFRDMALGGQIRQIPLSSVADIRYSNTFGGIKRKNQKRVITIASNVLSGYNANDIIGKVNVAGQKFKFRDGIEFKMTGEQEDQKESGIFLMTAFGISIGLILMILVTQFNSMVKPLIILSGVVLSLIGVLIGFSVFKMDFSIVMTGIGIVALAGIVVRNGILLVEFTDLLKEQGYNTRDAIIEAGKTRMTPVLLTATATILGLVPLAVGFNINFVSLFAELNPHIHLGGDSVAMWGPLSWTMIFGLSFATFLTLVLVPTMYYIGHRVKSRFSR